MIRNAELTHTRFIRQCTCVVREILKTSRLTSKQRTRAGVERETTVVITENLVCPMSHDSGITDHMNQPVWNPLDNSCQLRVRVRDARFGTGSLAEMPDRDAMKNYQIGGEVASGQGETALGM